MSSSHDPPLPSIYFLSCSEAVGAQCHLSGQVSSAGTQSAVGRVGAGAAEQQGLLLQRTVSAPRAVGWEQVVGFPPHAGAAYTESATWEMRGQK